MVSADSWTHPYSREKAAYPAPWLRERKFWTHCGRVDDTYGDRNLFCACIPPEDVSSGPLGAYPSVAGLLPTVYFEDGRDLPKCERGG
jgi:hypothetical protein